MLLLIDGWGTAGSHKGPYPTSRLPYPYAISDAIQLFTYE